MPVFPTLPGLTWKVGKSPRWSTTQHTSRSNRQTHIANWSYPEWEFDLRWEFLEDDRAVAINQMPSAPRDAFRQLLGFFLARRGKYEPFWFTDPTDCLIADTNDSVRQTIAVAQSGVTDYVVPRSIGGLFVEPIGAINAMSLYVNGNFQVGASYAINQPYDGMIHFGAAPTAGHVIKWSGTYYFRVRFDTDVADFDQFMYDLWENRGLRLVTAPL